LGGIEMKQLGLRGRGWLKFFHILFSAIWSGSVVCMLLLIMLNVFMKESSVNSIFLTVKLIDDYITAPFAICSLFTGFLFSLLTNWGFFKFKWIIVKWALTFACIYTGIMWLNPRISKLAYISKEGNPNLIENVTFLFNRQMLIFLLSIAVLVIIFIFLISVFKPWRKLQSF
jgi:hypothetical protein